MLSGQIGFAAGDGIRGIGDLNTLLKRVNIFRIDGMRLKFHKICLTYISLPLAIANNNYPAFCACASSTEIAVSTISVI